ncbi:LEAF RUST 10 DISEASE-RESISTANCE LOCUS RECEPTOR-LIKE PROTEIN KINASE-like 1.2 [Lycium ferocissimum]|uniref:LEAF RUST 10 DISEASE-RESISTANCE LOCUS RECEPTOR-LIKE PROTEIN KINASE-like 1.2 n=1 Tax=Lycium ferocissimum TaxID=112874 RepID=UPI0028157F93|nr:LEAF RUST 10 DISEASE-RESISTANCE LOCUS RECEPTOR-LIKE PROTEIN KINASE-like 1.2 [Lycium ferocissimum]
MEMIRKKLHEWGYCPYHYQSFNYDESPDWRAPVKLLECRHLKMLDNFDRFCNEYISFNFQIETRMVGGVRLCSHSELQQITDFNQDSDRFIRKTLHGRLFHGTVGEGSEKRSAFVKTWDFVLPYRPIQSYRPYYFCNEIELFTNKNANTHPNLAKLSTFCCDTRLAAVYDGKFTRVLSDVLPADDFGWDNRINVAIQLADLFAWLHEKGVVVGGINVSCIMIDEDMNIKVFDFGSVSNHVDGNSEIPLNFFVCRGAPDTGMFAHASSSMMFTVFF